MPSIQKIIILLKDNNILQNPTFCHLRDNAYKFQNVKTFESDSKIGNNWLQNIF